MTWFLDTNICVYYLKGLYPHIKKELLRRKPETIKVPVITKAELLFGAEKSQRRDENLEKINAFLLPFEIVSFSDAATATYATIRSDLETSGKLMGPNDLILAAIVLSVGGILVTNNTQEFRRVKSLKVEDWTK